MAVMLMAVSWTVELRFSAVTTISSRPVLSPGVPEPRAAEQQRHDRRREDPRGAVVGFTQQWFHHSFSLIFFCDRQPQFVT
jgi:hypothetical protein